MKASEVYRKAARMIERGENMTVSLYSGATAEGACDVLSCSGFSYSLNQPLLKTEFRDTFFPRKGYYWMVTDEMPLEDAQNWRVLALCFMAAIAEDEERGKGRRSN